MNFKMGKGETDSFEATLWKGASSFSTRAKLPHAVRSTHSNTFRINRLRAGPADNSGTERTALNEVIVPLRPSKNGGVPGYCWQSAICGTVTPLSLEKSTGSMGLCGQDSC